MTSPGREDLIRALPYARRYARALIGSQPRGDALVAASLRAMLDTPGGAGPDPRLALYASITRAAAASGAPGGPDADPASRASTPRRADAGLSTLQRQLLLLTALEGLSLDKAAAVAGLDEPDAAASLAEARLHLREAAATDVLIIEDEPIIAMDIEQIVRDLGHDVTGVAVTRAEAVALANDDRPGLVLADIQLADDSSGIDAVKDILSGFSVPVIFITAFPERLLTSERPEPTFLITKPFERSTVKAAIAQALFFNSTAGR